MRRIIKNILVQLNYKNIVEADDGSNALEVLKKEKVILLSPIGICPGNRLGSFKIGTR